MHEGTVRGSCLCGAVRFEVTGPLGEILHCHCRMCQKAHGAAFASFARIAHADFLVTQGDERIVSYRSSAEARRTFCDRCGSALQFVRDDADTFGLALSAVDTALEPQPVREYHVESKLAWLVPGACPKG